MTALYFNHSQVGKETKNRDNEVSFLVTLQSGAYDHGPNYKILRSHNVA